MKKTIVTILAALVSQSAFAADIYCGTNVEKVPGSGIYNKLVFWDKVDASKPVTHFLLKDGTLLRQQDFTPETVAKITDGSLGISISFSPNGTKHLFLGRVKRDTANEIKFVDQAIATSPGSSDAFLMANGAALMCKEM